MKKRLFVGRTLKENWLSLLSLLVALTALFYNTWRNEQTELNRNYRESGFEIIHEISELQLLVDQATYSKENPVSAPIMGWAKINFILTLSQIMPESVNSSALNLKKIWAANWEELEKSESSNKAITDANKLLEEAVLDVLIQLN